ncbi:Protein yippee-like [Striga hermonthica]|uniref:Protein yippee-like n=1 Tax=Striga hermonthica TaxID=68872 RepID=A0A9N7NCE1_STRHE|nr:Protein yippee-like [Striga hermonthica]
MDDKDKIGSRLFCCFRCRNIVAATDNIVNKQFVAGTKRAFLFSWVTNVSEGPKSDRLMISGKHMVSDVFCGDCGEILGWKYYEAYHENHKYKVGKTVLAKSKIVRAYDSTFY